MKHQMYDKDGRVGLLGSDPPEFWTNNDDGWFETNDINLAHRFLEHLNRQAQSAGFGGVCLFSVKEVSDD